MPGVLAALFIVPAAFLLGAFLWQLIPHRTALLAAWVRLPLFLASLSAALLASFAVGPFIERWLFAGDILRWLDGQVGTGAGGWLLLMLPLSAAGVTTAVLAVINPTLRRVSGEWGRATFALVNLAKFIAAAALTALLAYGLSCGLSAAGFDPRGGIVDTYIPRNALVVGFVMGFAIIPIIYTIAEDALSTVPAHLRSASLGAGATVWQTAVRVVVPTAMSGLFSALMIGLGRAVGETMIVLMAAGNTPILEINIFNGFRTLAANIAVELPEAAQQSTHYRTLFLAALTLFLLTFVVNTVAEIVRLRFRRKAVSL